MIIISNYSDFIINDLGIFVVDDAIAFPLITIPRTHNVEEIGAIYEVYSAGIISEKPVIIIKTNGDIVVYRLPDGLLGWVKLCIEAFKERGIDVFPDKVEFGILDGLGYYANFLCEFE